MALISNSLDMQNNCIWFNVFTNGNSMHIHEINLNIYITINAYIYIYIVINLFERDEKNHLNCYL